MTMRQVRKVRKVPAALAVALAACSQGDRGYEANRASERTTTVDVREAAGAPPAPMDAAPSMRMPGISPHAAPGVAFSYRYAFVLPDEAIAGVQEQHASACEKLGPTQCRITGMRYTLVDEDRVQALLQFKLSPELARQFGKDGIAAVEKASGRLVDAAIEGEDVGTQITDSQKRSSDLQAELKRIEARLAAGGIGDSERGELQAQADRLRQQLRGETSLRSEGETRLANTPMLFSYAGSQGFSLGSDPFGNAAKSGWSSFVMMITGVLTFVFVALPWLLLLGLVIALWRSGPVCRLRAVLFPGRKPVPPVEPPASST